MAYCREQVMRHDRDRFRTVLFAPPDSRSDLCVLYAFNLEVAKIPETVSEPMLGALRLQWWRDTLDEAYRGAPRRHAVATPLAATIAAHGLTRAYFDRLLDARAHDMDESGFGTMAAMTAYAEDTAGALLRLALETLGARDTSADAAVADHLGAAWALTGLLRALPYRLQQGRGTLPADLLARHGVEPRTLRAFRADAPVRAAVEAVAEIAAGRLTAARAAAGDRAARMGSPLLLAPLADIYLRRLRRAGFDPFAPDIAAPVPFAMARMALRRFWRGY